MHYKRSSFETLQWTKSNTENSNYIKDSKHKSNVLQTIHFYTSQTGENIAREITDKVVSAVTDSASNITQAIQSTK